MTLLGEFLAVQLLTVHFPNFLPQKLDLYFPGKLKVSIIMPTSEYFGIIKQNVGFELSIYEGAVHVIV